MRKFTVAEAAARVGRDQITIRRQIKDKKIVATEEKDGGRKKILIDESELAALYPKAFAQTSQVSRELQPCRIIALANQKGGVGKTTTCANLAAALSQDGTAVLVVDCDPQGNLTQALGPNPDKLDVTLYNVLVDRIPLEKAMMTPVLGQSSLSLVGANLELASVDNLLNGAVSRETRLRQALEPYLSRYEYILLDCPPTLGLLTLNALAAATEIMVPVDVGVFSLRGVAKLMATINEVRDVNPRLRRIRAVTNRTEKTNLSSEVRDELFHTFGSELFATTIRKSVKVGEAQASRVPITVHSPNDPVAKEYCALAEEVRNGG